MNSENPIVQMHNVCKRFGKTKALDEIDLEIFPGSIIGLLGANGAGKSTLLRHIIGLYLADEEKYVADYEISTKARVGSLSPGQRQRLAILLAIGFEPELLILDEPASTLDPIARAQFLDLLLQIIQDENRTIIISSHILSDVEKVIDHTVIMKNGHILLDCNFDQLRERFSRVRLSALGGELPAELPFANVVQCQRSNGQAMLTVQDSSREQIEEMAQGLNCQIEIQTLTLEDIYKIVVS